MIIIHPVTKLLYKMWFHSTEPTEPDSSNLPTPRIKKVQLKIENVFIDCEKNGAIFKWQQPQHYK